MEEVYIRNILFCAFVVNTIVLAICAHLQCDQGLILKDKPLNFSVCREPLRLSLTSDLPPLSAIIFDFLTMFTFEIVQISFFADATDTFTADVEVFCYLSWGHVRARLILLRQNQLLNSFFIFGSYCRCRTAGSRTPCG